MWLSLWNLTLINLDSISESQGPIASGYVSPPKQIALTFDFLALLITPFTPIIVARRSFNTPL